MKLKPIHWIVSIVVTIAVLFYIFKIQNESDDQTFLWNVLGGIVGLVAGLFIYNKFVDKEPKN